MVHHVRGAGQPALPAAPGQRDVVPRVGLQPSAVVPASHRHVDRVTPVADRSLSEKSDVHCPRWAAIVVAPGHPEAVVRVSTREPLRHTRSPCGRPAGVVVDDAAPVVLHVHPVASSRTWSPLRQPPLKKTVSPCRTLPGDTETDAAGRRCCRPTGATGATRTPWPTGPLAHREPGHPDPGSTMPRTVKVAVAVVPLLPFVQPGHGVRARARVAVDGCRCCPRSARRPVIVAGRWCRSRWRDAVTRLTSVDESDSDAFGSDRIGPGLIWFAAAGARTGAGFGPTGVWARPGLGLHTGGLGWSDGFGCSARGSRSPGRCPPRAGDRDGLAEAGGCDTLRRCCPRPSPPARPRPALNNARVAPARSVRLRILASSPRPSRRRAARGIRRGHR